jgi:hypothetical protein
MKYETSLWRWNRQSFPKRWHWNYRRRWITQKKAYIYSSPVECPYNSLWRHLESLQAPHSNSKPSWSSTEAYTPHLLQGSPAAEFQKSSRTWHINHKTAAMRRHLQIRTMNCQVWFSILGPGTKDISAEPYKSGRRNSGDDSILNFSWATRSPEAGHKGTTYLAVPATYFQKD